jgi:DNA polymerase II small subunit/DNA polymerase delta subunit B
VGYFSFSEFAIRDSSKDLFSKFRHQKFEPAGFVKNIGGGKLDQDVNPIRTASSIVDYVSQFMINNFGEITGKNLFESKEPEVVNESQTELTTFKAEEKKSEEDLSGRACTVCGAVGSLKAIGNCQVRCTSCNSTIRSGCGE